MRRSPTLGSLVSCRHSRLKSIINWVVLWNILLQNILLHGEKKKKTETFDVYAFAISAWEIFSGKSFSKEFVDRKLISVQVSKGTRPKVKHMGKDVPDRVVGIIVKSWHQNIVERPTFQTIRDTFRSQLIANQFHFELPRMKKSSKRSLGESYQRLCDKTDFMASVDDEIRARTRANHKFISGYRQVVVSLIEYLESNDNFFIRLKQSGVLDEKEYEQLSAIPMSVSNSCVDRNKTLLTEYLPQKIEYCCMEFIEALKDNDQEHIVNFIMKAGEHLDRVLSKEEIRIIDDNMSCLVNLIDPYKMGFLDHLVSANCITCVHRDLIKSCETIQGKNSALLTIIKRKSYKHYSNFQLGLRQTKQNAIVHVLTGGQTFVVRARVLGRNIGANFAYHVNNDLTENIELVETAMMGSPKVDELESSNIKLVGSHCEDSPDEWVIVSYLLCNTYQSIVTLKQMYDTGHLLKIMENIYCSKLQIPQSELIKTLKLDLAEFCSETSKELKRQHLLNGWSHYSHFREPYLVSSLFISECYKNVRFIIESE